MMNGHVIKKVMCKTCGATILLTGIAKKYCVHCALQARKRSNKEYSARVRRAMMPLVTVYCAQCFTIFSPLTTTRKYCSKQCKRLHHLDKGRMWSREYARRVRNEIRFVKSSMTLREWYAITNRLMKEL